MAQQDKGVLFVEVLNASDVPRDRFKKNDPYVVLLFKGVKKKTTYKKSEINPVWNEKFEIDLKSSRLTATDSLEVQLKDHENIGSNKLLGKGIVPLSTLLKCGSLKYQVELFDTEMNRLDSTKLFVNIEYKAPITNDTTKKINSSPIDSADTSDDSGIFNDSLSTEKSQESQLKSNVNHQYHKQRLNKIQDFQIRIKVIEARQLDGNNINPLCCVKCSNHTKYTKTMRSTNNPYWNEIFFFNFRTSAAELFDELIEFHVYNSLILRSDSLIGCFKIDIGYIRDEPNHSITHKWLLLSDTIDQVSNVKGYLKVTINVLGPGDEIPNPTDLEFDDEDIENNLLKPPGIMLRPATLVLKVFKAEDIPRMDSDIIEGIKHFFGSDENKKELVDPYVVFSFAGKKVHSKILYNNANPEWNQELKIGFKFPSLCDKIKISLKDWDRSSKDDIVGTMSLILQNISNSNENGFLPTFGPCFFNMYGGLREYSELPTKLDELNSGKGEGVAYRGRVLFEIQTILGSFSDEAVSEIKNNEVIRLDQFLHRKKYKLHAAFYEASMISEIEKPIEFEVSIGNYGNKLDENISPSSSTTPPTNAVFDGCCYYFLPWTNIKPYVQVTSYWEDIAYRLEAANQMCKMREYIEACIGEVKETFNDDLSFDTAKQLASNILGKIEGFVKNLTPLPSPTEHAFNDLDRFLYNLRQKCIDELLLEFPNTKFKDLLEKLENITNILRNLEIEPQNSIPDVIIWMLCGNERTSYCRIPAKDLFYSSNLMTRGSLCGKLQTITLKWPGKVGEDKLKKNLIPAQLRVKLWFGLEKDEKEWVRAHLDETKNGAITVFAETYENQGFNLLSKSWSHDSSSRPVFSDVNGKIPLPKDKFQLPNGWQWASEWEVALELSLMFEKDAGHTDFMEEVYEQHTRLLPGSTWSHAHDDRRPFAWTDYRGDKLKDKETIELENGWKWRDEWSVDINRAVDPEGWEYCIDPSMGGWAASEKVYHLIKRRRWIRQRVLIDTNQVSSSGLSVLGSLSMLMAPGIKHKEVEEALKNGWEYARAFSSKFHAKERSTDTVRRRRWHRQMKPSLNNDDLQALFLFNDTVKIQSDEQKTDKDREKINLSAPRMFLKFKKAQQFQLRAHLYQARSLLAGDNDTSLSDPYCQISFLMHSGKTQVIKRSISPIWDQCIIFERVNIYGDLAEIVENPPKLFIEIFDHDPYGQADYLGTSFASPKVVLSDTREFQRTLEWFDITKDGKKAGEMLALFELYCINDNKIELLPIRPPKLGNIYRIPTGIRPELERTVIEILCWGVRNMKTFQLCDIECPQVVFECGGQIVESEILKNAKKNPNFTKPVLLLDIMLPKEKLFIPPMTIKLLDHRNFGRKPIVGVYVVQSLSKYRVDRSKKEIFAANSVNTHTHSADTILTLYEYEKQSKAIVEDDIDWWSKFYASLGKYERCGTYLRKGYEKIIIYEDELEKQKKFEFFKDFCETFHLKRGKTSDEDNDEIVGEFKGMFKVYPVVEGDEDIRANSLFKNVQALKNEECLIRVYIVRGIDLQPKDPNGKSDPYIQIIAGKTKLDSRDQYVPNTNNPDFGKMFEFKVILPLQKDLCVRVKDYDMISSDEVIGETWIDLESRILTKYRANCGLPKVYNESGPNKWRDSLKPSQILENLCKMRNIPLRKPNVGEHVLSIDGETVSLDRFEKELISNPYAGSKDERLCLYVLHEFKLVPEHVETRKLYNPIQHDIQQGLLQMWVDIFPLALGAPGPAWDITPRKPKIYVLRCIIWNTKEVPFDDVSITGEKMSDIYVKGWLQGMENDKQRTDVHYRSLDGEGNFNWRFVFDFEYSPAEQMIYSNKKEHFWNLDETQTKLPPVLNIQIWDNDKFSADDFIGHLTLNLNDMIKPVNEAEKCGLRQIENNFSVVNRGQKKQVSLFEQRRMKGWWPCSAENKKNKKLQIAGKIEMELELLSEEEATQRPAGKGRESPNENPRLEPPNRPETSFLWLSSPLKTFKHIVWRRYKCVFIFFLLLLLVALFVVSMIYTMPSAIWSNIVFKPFSKT